MLIAALMALAGFVAGLGVHATAERLTELFPLNDEET